MSGILGLFKEALQVLTSGKCACGDPGADSGAEVEDVHRPCRTVQLPDEAQSESLMHE